MDKRQQYWYVGRGALDPPLPVEEVVFYITTDGDFYITADGDFYITSESV